MAALDPTKSKSSMKWKSSSSTEILQPYVEHLARTSPNPTNSNVRYQHIMSYLHSLNGTISHLSERVSQLASLVQPIVSIWNNHNSMNSYQVRDFIDELSLFHTNVSLHC